MKIVFTSSPSLISWLIRKATHSHVSHCFIVVDVMGGPCAVEADYSGMRVVPLEVIEGESEVIATFDAGVDIVSWEEVRRWLGRPYDYAGLLGFLWVILGRSIGVDLKNPARSPERVFCSESVVRILRSCGFDQARSLDPENTSPQDLLAFCQETMG